MSVFSEGAKALAAAVEMAEGLALAAVSGLGADAPQVTSSIDKKYLPDALDDNGLLGAIVRAEAIGRPDAAR